MGRLLLTTHDRHGERSDGQHGQVLVTATTRRRRGGRAAGGQEAAIATAAACSLDTCHWTILEPTEPSFTSPSEILATLHTIRYPILQKETLAEMSLTLLVVTVARRFDDQSGAQFLDEPSSAGTHELARRIRAHLDGNGRWMRPFGGLQ